MVEVRLTPTFKAWLDRLQDVSARARIATRLRRMETGNAGDVKAVGQGVSEMRIDGGPGCRVHFVRRENIVVVVLCGGDKRTQSADIPKAKQMAREL